jgi:hypothetical protein
MGVGSGSGDNILSCFLLRILLVAIRGNSLTAQLEEGAATILSKKFCV